MNPEGTGLGLSVAKLFITKMGGGIKVDSKIKKGSKFYVDLPVRVSSNGSRTYLVGGG
jgi:signal transduction histidine kinase